MAPVLTMHPNPTLTSLPPNIGVEICVPRPRPISAPGSMLLSGENFSQTVKPAAFQFSCTANLGAILPDAPYCIDGFVDTLAVQFDKQLSTAQNRYIHYFYPCCDSIIQDASNRVICPQRG